MADERTTDPTALAHPVRARILAHLRSSGAAPSAEVARALGTNTGVTSYHLRALGAAGFVTDSPGPGRRRVWEAVADPWQESARTEDDPEAAELGAWLEHDLVDLFAARAHRHLETREATPTPPGGTGAPDVTGLQEAGVLVSAEQAASLRAELDAVLARYRRVGQGTPGAQRMVAWTALLPVDS